MRTTINRGLLALIGLILLGGGLLVLAGGADIYRHWNLTPPNGWPLNTQHDALVPHSEQTRWAGQDWWWPASIAALTVLLLLALTWLVAQLGSRRRHNTILLHGSSGPPVTIDAAVVADAVTEDLNNLTGIQHARTTLSGPPGHAGARIDLTLEPDISPASALTEASSATERARRSLRQEALPTHVSLRVVRHRLHRVD